MSVNNTSTELKNLLQYLDIMLSDLTPQQISSLEKYSLESKNITPQKAFEVVKSLGLDIEKLQKNARRYRAEQRKNIIKIGPNEMCNCGSGKKYKKCCRYNSSNQNSSNQDSSNQNSSNQNSSNQNSSNQNSSNQNSL